MRPRVYYNEIDPFAAEWLRNLMMADLIAPGDVDERSIEDVCADDLRGYVQCHFFAGIGVWSYALRSAGWSDDRPVWTGSCPCQPFSLAGKGSGFADERHLWPAWYWLLEQLRPDVILGEQVASKPGLAWFDLVSADLEGAGYACGAVDLCAAGVGAPHIRQRLWWMAHHHQAGRGIKRRGRLSDGERTAYRNDADGCGSVLRTVVDAPRQQEGLSGRSRIAGSTVGESASCGWEGMRSQPALLLSRLSGQAWSDVDWIPCRDGKWRPVEPGTFPLAHGVAGRVGRLRAYGNAIVAPLAQAFIEAAMSCLP